MKWELKPPRDENFPCYIESHDKDTHPTDVVFHYKNPYTNKTIYVNTDLKSFTKSSINKNSVISALKSLAISIECANVSPEWQNTFCHDDNYDICALLFVYNYDGTYDKDFNSDILAKFNLDTLKIPKNQSMAIFDPKTIQYLLNVSDDIKNQLIEKEFASPSKYNFFYPQQKIKKTYSLDSYPATIEYILSPYMIINFNDKKYNDEYILYYKQDGDSVDEFIYLLDTLTNYQLIGSEDNIISIVLNGINCSNCLNNFNNAKQQYAESLGMNASDKIFQNVKARVLKNKHHFYNPSHERSSDE